MLLCSHNTSRIVISLNNRNKCQKINVSYLVSLYGGIIMDKDLRVAKLKEIKDMQEDCPAMTGIKIKHNGVNKEFNAYRIPLKYLIYNKYNGRIGRQIKSFERQYGELNSENANDKKKIEEFLWLSNKPRNENTLKNILKNEQQKYGIVTSDGKIIDGNRRAMILNRIFSKRDELIQKGHDVNHSEYFTAVILPGDMDAKEIMKLETMYQMGEDEKLGYDAIEKYLKCKDLKEVGFNESDIAEMMGETENQIIEWLKIMALMDDYLEALGYEGIYTRLEKREDQFINLNKAIQKFNIGSAQVDWNYNQSDISDLKSICFDYIRSEYEGKEFRNIMKPSKKDGIFCNKYLWEPFLKEHTVKIESISEPSIDMIREKSPDVELSNLLEARDEDWKSKVEDSLKANLGKSIWALENKNEANRPVELLKKALDSIEAINTEIDAFFCEEVTKLIGEINSRTWELKQIIKRRGK